MVSRSSPMAAPRGTRREDDRDAHGRSRRSVTGPSFTSRTSIFRIGFLSNRLILVIGLFGFAVDTMQASAGLYAFTHTSVTPWL